MKPKYTTEALRFDFGKNPDYLSKPFNCGQHLVGFDTTEKLSEHFREEHPEQPDNELDNLLDEILDHCIDEEPFEGAKTEAKQRLLAWRNKSIKEAVTKVTLAGMPELTPRQQDYITEWLKGGSNE